MSVGAPDGVPADLPPLPPLPQVVRDSRLLASERAQWAGARVASATSASLLARSGPTGDVLLALGDPDGVLDLLDGESRLHYRAETRGAGWLSAPRAAAVPAWMLDALALTRGAAWDWLSTDTLPDSEPEHEVARLPVSPGAREVEHVRTLLSAANPISTADPLGADEIAWFGVRERDELAGVVGARLAQGRLDRPDGFSWHLHGLSVAPRARRQGYARSLTLEAIRAGLAAGADWVSLGMYADNDAARALYEGLGLRLDAAMASYTPVRVR